MRHGHEELAVGCQAGLTPDAVQGDAGGSHLLADLDWIKAARTPIGKTVATAIQAVGRRVGNQDADLGGLAAEVQLECSLEAVDNSLRPVAAATGRQCV